MMGFEWVWVIGTMLIFLGILVVLRLLQVVRWGLSLKRELNALKERQRKASAHEAVAIGVVVSRCESILKAPFPDIPTIESLKEYVVEVAASCHPEASQPELVVSIGHLIGTSHRSLARFEEIMARPGLARLKTLRVKTIRKQSDRIRWMADFAPVRWYLKFRQWVGGFNIIRLILIPDPISWVVYLSGNLSMMILGKCLLADLSLFVGGMALDLYSPETECDVPALESPDSEETLEGVFEELGALDDDDPSHAGSTISRDPALAPLRKRITGLSALLSPTPDFAMFKETLFESAELVAEKHFPESETPLEELRVGPIMEGTRRLLNNLGKGERIPVAGKIYTIRLDTLASVKRFAEETIPARLKEVLSKGKAAYSWLKWPLMAYRITAKGGIFKVAASIGWRTAGKGISLYLYGRVYDHTLEELDVMCQHSNKIGKETVTISFHRP